MIKFSEYLEAATNKEVSIFAPYKTTEEGFKDIFREIKVRNIPSLNLMMGQLAATLEGKKKGSMFVPFTSVKKGIEVIEKEIKTIGTKASGVLVCLKRLQQTLKEKGKIK